MRRAAEVFTFWIVAPALVALATVAAIVLTGCIHTRTGPHDTPVIDGVARDAGVGDR